MAEDKERPLPVKLTDGFKPVKEWYDITDGFQKWFAWTPDEHGICHAERFQGEWGVVEGVDHMDGTKGGLRGNPRDED